AVMAKNKGFDRTWPVALFSGFEPCAASGASPTTVKVEPSSTQAAKRRTSWVAMSIMDRSRGMGPPDKPSRVELHCTRGSMAFGGVTCDDSGSGPSQRSGVWGGPRPRVGGLRMSCGAWFVFVAFGFLPEPPTPGASPTTPLRDGPAAASAAVVEGPLRGLPEFTLRGRGDRANPFRGA